jgi:hypothetical protein
VLIPLALLMGVVSSQPGAPAQPRIDGAIPSDVGAPARIVWVPIDARSADVRCDIIPPAAWSCDGVAPDTRGIVVMVGNDGMAARAVGVATIDPATTVWGRIVYVTPGELAPEELRNLSLSAFKPRRPHVRQQTRRFEAAQDDDVHVTKVSETTFWVGGSGADPDGFVALAGPGIGDLRVPTRLFSEGAPEDPVFVAARAGASIAGRVYGIHGDDADGAEVELWEPLRPDEPRERLDDITAAIRRAEIRAGRDGSFRFDRVGEGPMLLAASHGTLGAARRWITNAAQPVDLELTPRPRATGRVLKRGLPAASALIRFVPDADAFAASVDPRDHVTQEVRTANDGTFSLPLPPKHAGAIQIVLDDGSVARVVLTSAPIKTERALGDIAVPDGAHLTVRVLDSAGCGVVAVGPLGMLGLTTVRAASVSGVYELDLPEAGVWSLAAECGRAVIGIEPPVVVVPGDRALPPVDARVVRTPG